MERITSKDDKSLCRICNLAMCYSHEDCEGAITKVYDRLVDYEDTELTSEQITAMIQENKDLKDGIIDYKAEIENLKDEVDWLRVISDDDDMTMKILLRQQKETEEALAESVMQAEQYQKLYQELGVMYNESLKVNIKLTEQVEQLREEVQGYQDFENELKRKAWLEESWEAE